MITKIEMSKVASFNAPTEIATNKKVNLIYGLNGTGKSTISNFLYNREDPRYANCTIEGLSDEQICVYNQSFIRDYFFEDDRLAGIFTLSKENKEAEQKIRAAQSRIGELAEEKKKKEKAIEDANIALEKKKTECEKATWEIKTKYTGGDRVLKYCLDGYQKKEKLFSYLSGRKKTEIEPQRSIDELRSIVAELNDSNDTKLNELDRIVFSVSEIEGSTLLEKVIIGNESSSVFTLIAQLGNSDWVKDGLQYLRTPKEEEAEACPFCQSTTITKRLADELSSYFDKSYQEDIEQLKADLKDYQNAERNLPEFAVLKGNPVAEKHSEAFEFLISKLKSISNRNKIALSKKIKEPSRKFALESSGSAVSELNVKIEEINKEIQTYNSRITNKPQELEKVKELFWDLMRWKYDQTIQSWSSFSKENKDTVDQIEKAVGETAEKITKQEETVVNQQKLTVNIEAAVTSINTALKEMGIVSFEIVKHSETLYRLARPGRTENEFHSLSEGEKTVISFLYFLEMCRGLKSASEVKKKKIAVIDDPISSLSHIYVFHIGRIVKNAFFLNDSFEQIFVLTHSLYFFFEIAETNPEKRKETHKLHRISKNEQGSYVSEMGYSEIQNDYQSYWAILKDRNQPAILLANCMRNIIDHFFGFVQKTDFNVVFDKPALNQLKFQAFNRFMNRESHSNAINILDYKEFDYDIFIEGLRLLFVESGYPEHYRAMMKQPKR